MGRGIKEATWKHWHQAEVSLGIKRLANKGFPQYSHLMRWRGPEYASEFDIKMQGQKEERGKNKWHYIIGDGRVGLRDTPSTKTHRGCTHGDGQRTEER